MRNPKQTYSFPVPIDLTTSKTGRLKIVNVIEMKVWNRFAGSYELITSVPLLGTHTY